MKFEIEFEATIILSMRAVTGRMAPSKLNYGIGDTCSSSDPEGTTRSTPDPTPPWPDILQPGFCDGLRCGSTF